MRNTIDKLVDQDGSFDINKGYKHISGGNADKALSLINAQLDHIKNGEYVQSRRKSYSVASHNSAFDWNEYNKSKLDKPRFRKEEWICKQCKGQTFPSIGTIVDYQVPLKHQRSDECSGMGKVDLLSQRGSEAYLLEVKVPDNTEEPLRAIMEIYVYWKQLGGEECQNFLNHSALHGAITLKKAIVLFEESPIYKKLVGTYDKLQPLMKELGVECFVARSTNDGEEFIGDIVECKL